MRLFFQKKKGEALLATSIKWKHLGMLFTTLGSLILIIKVNHILDTGNSTDNLIQQQMDRALKNQHWLNPLCGTCPMPNQIIAPFIFRSTGVVSSGPKWYLGDLKSGGSLWLVSKHNWLRDGNTATLIPTPRDGTRWHTILWIVYTSGLS